ncbi:MAG: hypothetical protein GX336_05750 [Halanaerobiaceae bacterium]|nr:hypothetical protein [Halanaerobiaceae bacterium]
MGLSKIFERTNLVKINIEKVILMTLLVIVLATASGGVLYAGPGNSGRINIHPGTVQFRVEEPVSEVPANHMLVIHRNKKDVQGNVYYTVVDNSKSPIDLARYIVAKTPYYSDYQPLDSPVLFLAKEDDRATIELKLRLDSLFWRLVPDGKYDLHLVSDKGKSVNIKIWVNKVSFMVVTPDNINIVADNGPGTYYSQETASVYINSANNKWLLDIRATPLFYQGDNNEALVIEPGNIYISTDRLKNYRSLADVYRISGERYGNVANLNFYIKVDVGTEHFAGDYKGQIILTVSGQ